MKTIEEKAAALKIRWEELHKSDSPKPKSPKPTQTLGEQKQLSGNPTQKEKNIFKNELLNSDMIRDIFFSYMKGTGGIKVPDGVKNNSYNLQNLKEPITWVGNIAVGESRSLKGWWDTVCPDNVMLSYIGPGAKERCIEVAEILRSKYE